MEWNKGYLDLVLVPSGFTMFIVYHIWLWNKVRYDPLSTIIGKNSRVRHFWVTSIVKDNEKKNILAVQTLRNTIMGSTLMATTSILLCCGLAAVISSTYSVKKPIEGAVYGAHGEFMVAIKYFILLMVLLFSFLCHSLSIRFINQVNFLINCCSIGVVAMEYVSELLERALVLNTVGNRIFYSGIPLLLWIFGPFGVFLCFGMLVGLMYKLDVVSRSEKTGFDESSHGGGGENV